MKNKYQFALKNDGPWEFQETREITVADWVEFKKSMEVMIACLRDFGKDVGFEEVGKTEACIFDK